MTYRFKELLFASVVVGSTYIDPWSIKCRKSQFDPESIFSQTAAFSNAFFFIVNVIHQIFSNYLVLSRGLMNQNSQSLQAY